MARKGDNPMLVAALGAVGFLLPAIRPKRPAVPAERPSHPAQRPSPDDNPMRSKDAGDEADKPPAKGWWAITKRVAGEISANQLLTQSAAVTFYALLSIFPALAALVSIYGLIADPATIVKQMNALSVVMPSGGQQLLTDELKALTSASGKGLTWALIFGIATSLWTSNQAMKAIFNALNAVHEVKEKRGFFRLTGLTLACTVGMVVFMIVAMTAVVVVPAVLSLIGLGFVGELVNWLRWPLLLVGVALLLAVLFRYGPCRTKAVWRWISGGSAFASIGWVVVSVLFSLYVSRFGSYDKTYGSLGAVVGFMTWIWISTTVVLIGAQLNAELEKSTVGKQATRATSDQKPVAL